MNRPATFTLRVRRPFAAAGILAVAVLGACSTQSPLQTNIPYQPADGIAANSGPVQARNLLVVAAAKGGPGMLSGSLINTGSDPVMVTFFTAAQAQGGSGQGAAVQLRAGEQKLIDSVQLPAVADPPGALTSIVMQTPAGRTVASVPVLLPVEYYATLTPTASATTGGAAGVPIPPPTATATATPSAVATPSPAATPTVTAPPSAG